MNLSNEEIVRGLKKRAGVWACGSVVTCDPIPEHADEDYLVLTGDLTLKGVEEYLGSVGFGIDMGDYCDPPASEFTSWKPIEVPLHGRSLNFIVTKSVGFWDRYVAATSVCKMLNILDKSKRIALFRAVLYGEVYDDRQKQVA